ncbi:tyrosine-type recombinase/integrase [Caballeronia sp. DA-9]|uniref:tyrosine-type recombinase/integrase n=1 Tax=Caballeronia sp. DA-9 TaxID=3436237 RepID=UPI003F66C76A
MNDFDWLNDPQAAYDEWQRNDAVGADRRPFAEQSITQHRSMFARFHRHLATHGKTVATFGAAEIDNFFNTLAQEARPDTTTQLRYLKLIDRVSRHLVAMEVRKDNPASLMLVGQAWPEAEPTPIFLSETNDKRLQLTCVTAAESTFKELRSVAIVAMFLGTGITAAECRQLGVDDLNVDGLRPDVYVKKRGPRIARRVPLEPFCIDILREYVLARKNIACPTSYLFIATGTGKPMKDDTLGKSVRNALEKIKVTAADMSPRLLRNTYGRRRIIAGCTNEQVSNLLGLSSHRTTARLRHTLELSGLEPIEESRKTVNPDLS